MKNLPQASMLGTKMRSATEECEQRARRECGWGAMAGAFKKRCHPELVEGSPRAGIASEA